MSFSRRTVSLLLAAAGALALPAARAADSVNVYSIWPENWARPMFEEFEKATGVKVNFVRFSSGEALARVIGMGVAACDPQIMGWGPVPATKKAQPTR